VPAAIPALATPPAAHTAKPVRNGRLFPHDRLTNARLPSAVRTEG
jgi:hypothetical protein